MMRLGLLLLMLLALPGVAAAATRPSSTARDAASTASS